MRKNKRKVFVHHYSEVYSYIISKVNYRCLIHTVPTKLLYFFLPYATTLIREEEINQREKLHWIIAFDLFVDWIFSEDADWVQSLVGILHIYWALGIISTILHSIRSLQPIPIEWSLLKPSFLSNLPEECFTQAFLNRKQSILDFPLSLLHSEGKIRDPKKCMYEYKWLAW